MSSSNQGPALGALHLDEEDCLSFDVFNAELELLMSTTDVRKGGVTTILTAAQGTQAAHSSAASGAGHSHGHGQHKPDLAALLELLQKMAAAIPRTSSAVLRKHQQSCEDWLYGLLQQGPGPVVSAAAAFTPPRALCDASVANGCQNCYSPPAPRQAQRC